MNLPRLAAMLCVSLALPLQPARSAPHAEGPQVAWLPAASDADVDRAFAQGRAEKKPVLLYWGAVWCPPCNQLKATLFNRQDFIARSRHVVPVYVDGDGAGAQKLGDRFRVGGYPTLVLFSPEGQEITSLPGEADAPQVMKLLQIGLAGGRPVKAVLADAKAGKTLSANEWRLLAYFAWAGDGDQLVSPAEMPGLLLQLAALCPRGEKDSATHLLLSALAVDEDTPGVVPDAAMRQRVTQVLAKPQASRIHMDVLVNAPRELALRLAPAAAPERARWLASYDAALQRLQRDTTLSRADRVSALQARVELARLDQDKKAVHPPLPAALQQQVRDEAARQDREISNGYERQAVITSVAYLLGRADLWPESDALLKANLAKSHSAYYLMSSLGYNAKQLGRKAEAVNWYAQAYDKSTGPATRLQWGANYVTALVDLTPQDEPAIEQATSRVLKDAIGQQAAFFERSQLRMQTLAKKLAEWNARGQHAAVVSRLRTQWATVCTALPAGEEQRGRCEGLFKS